MKKLTLVLLFGLTSAMASQPQATKFKRNEKEAGIQKSCHQKGMNYQWAPNGQSKCVPKRVITPRPRNTAPKKQTAK